MVSKLRLDQALAEAGMAASRTQAQALIASGRVKVAGETVRQPDRQVGPGQELEVVEPPPYVGRGGFKLAGALDAFEVSPAGKVCLDVGASTGGFTDVLLQRGASRVYAVDVGRGLLHEKLRQDPRVVVMDRVNARGLKALPEPVQLVVVDVSFIGLEKVLPAVAAAAPEAEIVALFKPQFQVDRGQVGKGGVVRDEAALEAAAARFAAWCPAQGLSVAGREWSVLPGAEGNREIFFHLLPAP